MSSGVVLVLDSDERVRARVSEILAEHRVRVVSATRGSDALEMLRHQAFDVIFLALELADENAISVMAEARRIARQTAIVVMTGAASVESSVEAMRNGANDYLFKPVTSQKIATAFERAMQARKLLRPAGPPSARPAAVDAALPGCEIITENAAMQRVILHGMSIADSNLPVLIQGEVGVGKSLLARTMHRHSRRADRPALYVCGSMSDALLDFELFFASSVATPAKHETRRQSLEQVNGGSLIVRNIDELSLQGQAWLLSYFDMSLEEGYGGPTVRIVATTTHDLHLRTARGSFRRELYDRLTWIKLKVPPLRERAEDVQPLCKFFLAQFFGITGGFGKNGGLTFSAEALARLQAYDWPGNVGELARVVVRAAAVAQESKIGVESLPSYVREFSPDRVTAGEMVSVPLEGGLKKIEQHLIQHLLQRNDGNKAAVARTLGLHRRTLYRLLERYERE